MPENRGSLPDRLVRDVPVWTVRPGTMARGWAARVQGPVSALDLELVPAIDLWEVYQATCDGIPLPFGAWMTQDGPTTTVAEVEELREAYDTVGEQLAATEIERDRLRAENETLKEEQVAFVRALEQTQGEVEASRSRYESLAVGRDAESDANERLREALAQIRSIAPDQSLSAGYALLKIAEIATAALALTADEDGASRC